MSSSCATIPAGCYPACHRRGFTLIELLTVIAIIGILAGITFGVMRGVNERAAMGQARAELAAIAQALEQYKSQYGDYPQTGGVGAAGHADAPAIGDITTGSSQSKFINALSGKLGPRLAAMNGKQFLDLSKFNLETGSLPDPTNDTEVANALLDPWGYRYMYFYKNEGSPTTWRNPGYVLYSVGPDGLHQQPTNGVLDDTHLSHINNRDNVYANR